MTTYTVTRDDLFVHHFFDRDGLTYAAGENKLGVNVVLPLDVPLCGYCDTPVPSSGYCESCDEQHWMHPLAELSNPEGWQHAA